MGSFSPNKQVFLPKKTGSVIGCRDMPRDLHLRHILHFSGLPSVLYWTLVGNDDVMAALVSEGPSSCVNPTRGCPTLLKASFVSVAQFLECIFQIIFHLLLQALGTHVVLT